MNTEQKEVQTEGTSDAVSSAAPKNKKGLFVGGAILILICVVAGIAYVATKEKAPVSSETGTPSEEERTVEDSTPGYTIEEVPLNLAEIMPNLDRGVVFADSIPSEVRTLIENKVAAITTRLKDDPTRADDWFELGIQYHNANDYKGAEEVWLFLTQVAPSSTTAYDNLGKLYHFSLKDYPASEKYFLHSLTIDTEDLNAYLGLFELYRYSYKFETTVAATNIMKKAMQVFPDRFDLWLTLGTYYSEKGEFAAARAILTEGLDKARDANDLSMVSAFGTELERVTTLSGNGE